MAASILSPHPLDALPSDSELALILEQQALEFMLLDELEELVREAQTGHAAHPQVWGYLYALWEQRRIYGRGGQPPTIPNAPSGGTRI